MYPIRSLFQVLAESHGVLEKYTQPTVLNFISNGINPLTIPSRETRKVILFCDIVAFSHFSAVLSVQEIVSIVSAYFGICSNAIVKHGGEVAKYIGDCVMAYFDYEDADRAIQAGLDILADLERERESSPEDSPLRLLYTGIGIAAGLVIEGNIGSEHKMEYTVLGDAVNQAAFLENLTRDLPRSLVLSSDVKGMVSEDWPFLPLGEFDMKRGQDPIPVFSVDDPLTLSPGDPHRMVQSIGAI
jgi:class 3 adenylate cyclase